MGKHLKNIVMNNMKGMVSSYFPSPALSTPPARGVRYLQSCPQFDFFWGAMDKRELGRKRRKHIVVRRYRHNGKRLLQLYTYHFPTHWSEACVANRELIKIAQRQAHAFEHDTSRAALEWHIRFLKHYFTLVKGNAAPEPGFKRYTRFYQYTFVALYRELQAARQKAIELALSETSSAAQCVNAASNPNDITFEPVGQRSLQAKESCPLDMNIIRRPLRGHCALHRTSLSHWGNKDPIFPPLYIRTCKAFDG